MSQRARSQPAASPSRPGAGGPDAYALAGMRLEAQRPLRDPVLKQADVDLDHQRTEAARSALQAHLAQHPDDPDTLHLLARAALREGRRLDALALLDRCLQAAPEFAMARYNRARLLAGEQRIEEALADLDMLLARDPRNPLFREMKAVLLEGQGDNGPALATFQQLAAENPLRAEAWLNYGNSLRAVGERDKSIAAYRMALTCRPAFGYAWWGLANLRTAVFTEADLRSMEELLQRRELGTDDRIRLHYALGKGLEDVRSYEKSFVHYERGNALNRTRIVYDPALVANAVAQQKALFTPAFFAARANAGADAPDPVFVISRPRSGSTLVEQILASHPAIEGTAELPYIGMFARRLVGGRDTAFGVEHLKVLEGLPASELRALGEEYLSHARRHRKLDRPYFLDKMPANFFHVGLIALILPNARIVEVRRNPAATCFSIFKSYTTKGSLAQAELGQFHRDYTALMQHFAKVLPGRIHAQSYEELVTDPEREVRALLDALGLPFDERCLRFYETRRAVLTPSSEQVRRPMSRDAIDHWRRYEPWLGPLLAGLGSVYADYPGIPPELR
jgi:tetratricopeptide (TPR) repeat protein